MSLSDIYEDYFGCRAWFAPLWLPVVVLLGGMPLCFVTDRWWPIMGRDADYL